MGRSAASAAVADARQRTLHERLRSQDAKLGATLGAMYVGAITVLESDSPDRVSQAAHSCRELIEKLVRTRAEPAKPGVGNPRDRGSELEREWTAYSASVGVGAAGLDGRTVDRGLTTVLIRVEAYCESARSACSANPSPQASRPVNLDRRSIRADERDVDSESHRVGDVGQLAEREVTTTGFDGGDVGGGDSQALGDRGLGQPKRLAGVFNLAADDLRMDLRYRRSWHGTQAAVE
jgi:hypothetical protein